ncbi:alpha/beta fold hydrolase [Agrococcus carbonis]|uniref:Pimeloyl-ACP methyl ester carboxylesterase n=1 Tax=Agrococcus carbonis TaxID=684552 RepID=A0A1H1NB36_9MICO|nr:alpha/beta hydrolase [Agrococcus carbonis]SDR96137.1 Pimeloyl-ACP methyl ester carboxylesterase [Agrococcus carbonis]
MQHARSADGTPIAFHRRGSGTPVIVIGGAFSTAADASAIADALSEAGFEAVTVDRRARGDSGDGPADARERAPFSPEREAEDVAAVIDAVGGSAVLLGHSSGALVALLAAAHGAPVTHLFLSEPPMRFGLDEPAADLPERLQSLVDAGRTREAVLTFQREGIELPEPMIEQIAASELMPHLESLAQSTVYDATIAAATSDPDERMLHLRVPTTVLLGAETFPLLERAAPMLVERMPSAELVRVPESRGHSVDPAATAAIVAARVR